MTGRMVAVGAGLGVVLWFFLAVYFGVLVEATFPRRAAYLREMASAALFPMSVISALVMVRQGMTAPLARFVAALTAGGVLWFGLAAGVGTLLVAGLDPESVHRVLPAVNAGLLVIAFGVGWWVVRRWGADALERWGSRGGTGQGQHDGEPA